MGKLFVVDAETDGLYGTFLSVAALVTDENGEIAHFYGAQKNPTTTSDWVRENVVPHLKNAETLYSSEKELLEAFWQFWMRHKDGAVCVADVGVPVESRLFLSCVMQDLESRQWEGPYPLHDLATLLLARGIDPDVSRGELATRYGYTGYHQHDALEDVRVCAHIWNALTGK